MNYSKKVIAEMNLAYAIGTDGRMIVGDVTV